MLLRILCAVGLIGAGFYVLSAIIHMISHTVTVILVLLLVAAVYRILTGPSAKM
jgi:hypothetical protein